MFEKGNNHGVKFSKANQPKNPGRRPSRLKELEDSLKFNDEYEKFSPEDFGRIYSYILGATKPQIERLLRHPLLPFCIACHLRAVITDAQNGNTKTINEIMDRVWGKSLQPLEVTGGGVPLIPDTPMSRKEYEQLLKDLMCQGQQNTKIK